MATKLYVGKLAYSTTESALKELFAAFGAVTSVAIIMDRETNQSKGFGFVEMEDEAAAKEAIAALNDKDFDGRTIVVSEARPQTDRPRPGGDFRGDLRRG